MSFCIRNLKTQPFPEDTKISSLSHIKAVPQNSRNRYVTDRITRLGSPCKKTSLCIRKKASYTLEAAIIIPLVAAFFVFILFFFRVLQVQTQVQEALEYASRKSASEASAVNSEMGLMASAEVYFLKGLHDYNLPERYVKGGKAGVSLLRSNVSDCYIDLQADYYIRLPVNFFTVKGIAVSQSSKSRKWTGDRDEGEEDDYVYVTETGTVYHRDRMCHYLDLSIRIVNFEDIKGLRNKGGHKYYACGECVAGKNTGGTVYITDYGTAYHASLSCSGLKRTIYLIPLSDVGGRGPCSKCGGTGP